MFKWFFIVTVITGLSAFLVSAAPTSKTDLFDTVSPCDAMKMHSNQEIFKCFMTMHRDLCPDVTNFLNLGNSTFGEPIFGLHFSGKLMDQWMAGGMYDQEDNSSTFSEEGNREKTHIGLLANMHGNEATGRELLLWLAFYLCKNHQNPEKRIVRHILKSSEIYIIPTINPDGFSERYLLKDFYRDNSSKGQRYMTSEEVENFTKFWVSGRYVGEKGEIDMNRNFPKLNTEIYGEVEKKEASELVDLLKNSQIFNKTFIEDVEREKNMTGPGSKLEKETQLIIDFLDQTPLDFAINFHDGARVVNYPFDYGVQGERAYTATPDDDLYLDTSKVFAYNNPSFLKHNICGEPTFHNGITNGANWYSVKGGLQDYSYIKYGTMHITIELSCDKFPTDKHVEKVVKSNKWALLSWIYYVTKLPAVYGQVEQKNAKVEFRKRDEENKNQAEDLQKKTNIDVSVESELENDQENSSIINHSDSIYWTISDKNGHFKKQLPKYGVYDIFIDGQLTKSVYVMDSMPVNYHRLYTMV